MVRPGLLISLVLFLYTEDEGAEPTSVIPMLYLCISNLDMLLAGPVSGPQKVLYLISSFFCRYYIFPNTWYTNDTAIFLAVAKVDPPKVDRDIYLIRVNNIRSIALQCIAKQSFYAIPSSYNTIESWFLSDNQRQLYMLYVPYVRFSLHQVSGWIFHNLMRLDTVIPYSI